MSFVIPNTTQIPHMIIREWMPRISDVELRVLLVVTDQTLGWMEDAESGRRKDRDWISSSQLVAKTGRSRKHVSAAVKKLVETHHIVQTVDESGRLLNTAQKRKYNYGKMYYRLDLHSPPPTLFDTPRASKGRTVRNGLKQGQDGKTDTARASKRRTQKGRTTNETLHTKLIHADGKPSAPDSRKKDHTAFVEFWYGTVERTRGIKPMISGADGKNLKRVLDAGVPEQLLEQIALFFLADFSFRKFAPTIATLCSSGILTGLLNRTKNDPEFNRKLNGYAEQYIPRAKSYGLSEFQAGLQQLASKFSMASADRCGSVGLRDQATQ